MVSTYADDLRAESVEVGDVLGVSADLALTGSRERLGEEEQHEWVTMVIGERVEIAVGAHKGEVRGAFANCDHRFGFLREWGRAKRPVDYSTGLPAAFHATVPPSSTRTLVKPMSCSVFAASAAWPPGPQVVMIGTLRS